MQQQEFAQRRRQLMAQMQENSIAIIYSGTEKRRNGDCYYGFRPNSDFYYLTGFAEYDAVAVLCPGHPQGDYILFNLKKDPAKETWYGRRVGQQQACEDYLADSAYPIEQFDSMLADLLQDRHCIYMNFGVDSVFEKRITDSINHLRAQARSGVSAPLEIVSLDKYCHEMRLIKSEAEIALHRKAGDISARAHCRAMKVCQPGMMEYELEAELMHEFYRSGSRSPAYNNIVASGENSCILHYGENNRQMQDGDLVLIDAGCEYEFYASDITRTFPVNGKFSSEQQAIYELVLATQMQCLAEIKPGKKRHLGQQTAIRSLTQGLVDLGILSGSVDGLIESGAYRQFYMHRLSHWMGIDVHDVGVYRDKSGWRILEENMVYTVEPGLYITPADNVDEKWWNIGVRIEDDVVVTADGCDILTPGVPKTIADIEALMKS